MLPEEAGGVAEGDEHAVVGGDFCGWVEDALLESLEDQALGLWIDFGVDGSVEQEEDGRVGLLEDAKAAEAGGGSVVESLDGGEASDPCLQSSASLCLGYFFNAFVEEFVAGRGVVDDGDEALLVFGEREALLDDEFCGEGAG